MGSNGIGNGVGVQDVQPDHGSWSVANPRPQEAVLLAEVGSQLGLPVITMGRQTSAIAKKCTATSDEL